MNFSTDYVQSKKEGMDHLINFSTRTLDEIWSSNPINLDYSNNLTKLWESKEKTSKRQEVEELPEEISKLYKQQEDELVKVLNLNDQEKDFKNTISPLPIKPPKSVFSSPSEIEENNLKRVQFKKDSTKREEKFNSSSDGKKLLQFRTSYLNWCDKFKLAPASELLRTLKNSIRNQTPFVRLSICHANIDDLHVQVLVNSLKVHDGINEILLNHNDITDKGACLMAEALLKHKSITSLELFGNKIGDESQKVFSDLLKENQNLKRLKLGDNLITAKGAEYLSIGLTENYGLTQLHLGGNKIEVQGLKFISKSLLKNKTLTSLGLRDNNVGPDGMEFLSDILQQKTCELSDIQLKGNHISAKGALYLSKALQFNSSLKVLELQSNSIGHSGARLLCEALKDNHSIHALNFNDNELGDEGVEYIAKLLISNPIITTLGLANNKIRKKGASALADALKDPNSSVTGLDLGNNELGNAGACAIAESLLKNTVLTSLDLRSCEIHLKGISGLSDMARVNTTLRHLDLGNNYAKNQGAIDWADVLSKNNSLTRLCLTDNQIYHEGGEALARALQTNYTLRNFSYGGQGPSANRIDSAIRRVIDGIINENKKNWEENEQQNALNQQQQVQTKPVEKVSLLAPINTEKIQQLRNIRNGNILKQPLQNVSGLPNWFTSQSPAKESQLDYKLASVFSSNLLKAENPKFPGCYFIGNIYNTLRKIFPETTVDEVQLVQFAYNNPKYYVHLSREMVKTQIKYLGESKEEKKEEKKEERKDERFSPLFRESPNYSNPNFIRESPNSLFRESPSYLRESPSYIRESPNSLFRESPNLTNSLSPRIRDISPVSLLNRDSSPVSLLREEVDEKKSKSPIGLLKESPRETNVEDDQNEDDWDQVLQLTKQQNKKGKFGAIGEKIKLSKKKKKEEEVDLSKQNIEK